MPLHMVLDPGHAHTCMDPRTLTRGMEGVKKWQTQIQRNRKGGVRWVGLSDGEVTAHPACYYIDLNGEMGFLHMAEQGGGVITNR